MEQYDVVKVSEPHPDAPLIITQVWGPYPNYTAAETGLLGLLHHHEHKPRGHSFLATVRHSNYAVGDSWEKKTGVRTRVATLIMEALSAEIVSEAGFEYGDHVQVLATPGRIVIERKQVKGGV